MILFRQKKYLYCSGWNFELYDVDQGSSCAISPLSSRPPGQFAVILFTQLENSLWRRLKIVGRTHEINHSNGLRRPMITYSMIQRRATETQPRTETMTSIERVKKLFPKTLSCLARHVGNWLYQFEAHSVHRGSSKSYHGTESLRMFTPVCFWRTLFPKFPKTHKFGRPAVPCRIPSSLGWSRTGQFQQFGCCDLCKLSRSLCTESGINPSVQGGNRVAEGSRS